MIEVVSIGSELLKGRIVNTNATFICRHLQERGYTAHRQMTVPDEPAALRLGLEEALGRSTIVIATGGLGPTLDDTTRKVAADLYGCDFQWNQTLADELKARYPGRYDAVSPQAWVPAKATLIPNLVGSAPGLLFSEQGKTLILMPGVPKEMEPMFIESVLPFIEKGWPLDAKQGTLRLSFCLVYESLLDPHLRELSLRFPSVEAGIYPAHGTVSVQLFSSNAQELDGFKRELCARFGSYLYASSDSTVEETLQAWFVGHGKTLALAESCTGGMIASSITSIPGASNYFLGSLVVYSNAMKENLLGVLPQTLAAKGAVSREVVEEMLQGVLARTGADYGIAVSGIAGPAGATPDKPVGTVWAAIGQRGLPADVGTFLCFGNRQTILRTSSTYLLGALWRKVEKGIPAFPLILGE